MTNKQQIEMARNHLKNGNKQSYITLMASMLRRSMSQRTTNQINKAADEDNMLHDVLESVYGDDLYKWS